MKKRWVFLVVVVLIMTAVIVLNINSVREKAVYNSYISQVNACITAGFQSSQQLALFLDIEAGKMAKLSKESWSMASFWQKKAANQLQKAALEIDPSVEDNNGGMLKIVMLPLRCNSPKWGD